MYIVQTQYLLLFHFMSCTGAHVLTIFKNIKYSEWGSNMRRKEEETFSMFVDSLDECEKGKSKFDDVAEQHIKFCLICDNWSGCIIINMSS